ncbi:MAG: hypothetical protein PHD79_11840 [Aliarcobacter sp.]|jgi:hypothetical protein|nr:hypothetical protein [Aliarcobacter sp.]
MKKTDYAGLSHFQEYCKEFDEQYVVVGGFATVMLLDEELGKGHGKATFDIDLVLLTNNSVELSQRIKQYITDGKYDIQVGEKDRYKYYRFNNPKEENFAKEIELFASNENKLEIDDKQRILPIDPEEGLYSLSAIMLDPEYFKMIKNNVNKSTEAPCTNTQATIMLKMSAFYDLKKREDNKWKKHRRDILKLTLLLTGEEEIKLVGRMKEDFDSFIQHLKEEVDQKSIKSFADGLPIYKEQVIEILEKVFHKS